MAKQGNNKVPRENGTCACFWCYWLAQPSHPAGPRQAWQPEFYCFHPKRQAEGKLRQDNILPDSPDPEWCPGFTMDKPELGEV